MYKYVVAHNKTEADRLVTLTGYEDKKKAEELLAVLGADRYKIYRLSVPSVKKVAGGLK